MKILLPLILFCTLILGGYSAVFQMSRKNYSRVRSCYEEEMNFHNMREKTGYKDKSCMRMACTVRNGKISLELQGCGSTGPAVAGCYKTTNSNLPYPYCCERYVCPNESETLYYRTQKSPKRISAHVRKSDPES